MGDSEAQTDIYLHCIERQYEQLRHKKDLTPLLREALAVYTYILMHDDPARVARAYMHTRHESKTVVTPGEAAKILRWEIEI